MIAYFSLFIVSFISATLIPSQSELLLASLIFYDKYNLFILLTTASIGNILGSITNYFIGKYISNFENNKFFNKNSKSFKKATAFYEKYGKISLFFAWLPFIGDPLTLIAGFFKINLKEFIIIISIGKTLRYVIVVVIAVSVNIVNLI